VAWKKKNAFDMKTMGAVEGIIVGFSFEKLAFLPMRPENFNLGANRKRALRFLIHGRPSKINRGGWKAYDSHN
jgi:hypothetical protein